jgi:hypothetical protein
MLVRGTHVTVEFDSMTFEGVVTKDCEDWGAEPLHIIDDETGESLRLNTWLAHDVYED